MLKKCWLILMMVFCLTTAYAGNEQTIVCNELKFETKVNFDCRTEYEEGTGLYVHLYEDRNMPYILINVQDGASRVTDATYYVTEYLPDYYQELYGPNGSMSLSMQPHMIIGGKEIPAIEVQYHNQDGYLIFLLTAVDVRSDCTVFYRMRYLEQAERSAMLNMLDTVSVNLTYTGNVATTREQTAHNFRVTQILLGDHAIGRITAPSDFRVKNQLSVCTKSQSATNPWLLLIGASNEDMGLVYASGQDYLANAKGETADGEYNTTYHTPMLTYMDAGTYCDYWALSMRQGTGDLTVVDSNGFPAIREVLAAQEQAFLKEMRPGFAGTGVTLDGVAYTVARKWYQGQMQDGTDYYICVLTGVRGYQITSTMTGPLTTYSESTIAWEAPCTYAMWCKASVLEDANTIFEMFSENTSVTDQFLQANKRLSTELWNILTGRNDPTTGTTYAESVMRAETQKGEDYREERFTDYLYDQNDYTLTDGSHVKISTSYDYVYEGDNGIVYYSNSAFSQPGGSTPLYPN